MAKYSPPSRTFSIPRSARRKVYVTSPVFELTTFTFLSYSSSTVLSSVRYKLGDNRKYIFHTSTQKKLKQIHQVSIVLLSGFMYACVGWKNWPNHFIIIAFEFQVVGTNLSEMLMFLILFSTLHLSMLFAFKNPFKNQSELLFCSHNRCTFVFACNFNEMTFQYIFFRDLCSFYFLYMFISRFVKRPISSVISTVSFNDNDIQCAYPSQL